MRPALALPGEMDALVRERLAAAFEVADVLSVADVVHVPRRQELLGGRHVVGLGLSVAAELEDGATPDDAAERMRWRSWGDGWFASIAHPVATAWTDERLRTAFVGVLRDAVWRAAYGEGPDEGDCPDHGRVLTAWRVSPTKIARRQHPTAAGRCPICRAQTRPILPGGHAWGYSCTCGRRKDPGRVRCASCEVVWQSTSRRGDRCASAVWRWNRPFTSLREAPRACGRRALAGYHHCLAHADVAAVRRLVQLAANLDRRRLSVADGARAA